MKSSKQTPAMMLIAAAATLWCGAVQAQSAAGPFTKDQLDAGRGEFQTNCSECHKPDLTGQQGPALIGKKFADDWGPHTAGELYKFVQSTMPMCEGGLLGNSTYADVVAFVLWANGANPGTAELNGDSAAKIGDFIGKPRTDLTK